MKLSWTRALFYNNNKNFIIHSIIYMLSHLRHLIPWGILFEIRNKRSERQKLFCLASKRIWQSAQIESIKMWSNAKTFRLSHMRTSIPWKVRRSLSFSEYLKSLHTHVRVLHAHVICHSYGSSIVLPSFVLSFARIIILQCPEYNGRYTAHTVEFFTALA